MVFIDLFATFMKIGFTSFGGMSMIPLITQEMLTHQWMTADDVSNIIAIAEMTPGPFGLNCATFAGMQVAGVMGGIMAVLGVLMPSYSLTLAAAICFARFKKSSVFEQILWVIRPVCVGLLLSVIISLIQSNYFDGTSVNFFKLGIGAVVLVLLLKFKWSVPKVIGLSAVLGILFFGGYGSFFGL